MSSLKGILVCPLSVLECAIVDLIFLVSICECNIIDYLVLLIQLDGNLAFDVSTRCSGRPQERTSILQT